MRLGNTFRIRLYLVCTFAEAVAVSLLSRIRRAIGRRGSANPQELFLRVFLLHAVGRQPRLRITCADRSDGAGAQAHTMMSAMNFARAYGHTYVHTPFSAIDHGDRSMGEWVRAWEELFNLGEGEEVLAPDQPKAINYSTFHPRLYHIVCSVLERRGGGPPWRRPRPGDPENHFQPFFYHSDVHPNTYRTVIPGLRRKYHRGQSVQRMSGISVAVHVRRGDVTAAHPQRFTPTDVVCATTRMVTAALAETATDFSIALYSQGEAGDFEGLESMGVRFFLDADPLWTMRQLVAADVLVMSRSSFSYVAALISDGIKLYEPFWHSPLDDWIIRNPDGGFDPQEFRARLADRIECRGRQDREWPDGG